MFVSVRRGAWRNWRRYSRSPLVRLGVDLSRKVKVLLWWELNRQQLKVTASPRGEVESNWKWTDSP